MKLVGTRDIYMKVFPKSIDVVPEYVGGILEFLNGTYNGANANAGDPVRRRASRSPTPSRC